MAVDKNKVVAEATKLVQKGQFDKAIKAYQKILADDPDDVRILLKVGELQQKKGDNAAAAQTFGRVADAYGEQGFFLKAVAVYKQMLKLAPDDIRVNERLAGLYQQLGIVSDAMIQLQVVATAAEKAGDAGKLLDVLKRMVDLDPENIGSAVKLGELYAKQSQTTLALDQLRRAADQLKRNNRTDEYVKVAERIAFLAPQELALTRELANIYLAKGDTKRALAKLQLCFKADARDIDTLTLLAQAFKDLGQVTKTVSVYRELAHLYAEKGRVEDAQATWRSVLDLAPDDAEATRALAPPRPPRAPAAPPPPPPPPRSAAPAAGPPPGAKRAVSPAVITVPPPVPSRASPAPAPVAAPLSPPAPAATGAAAGAAAGGGPRAGGPEAIPKLLTETDVYVKYGLHEKALEHLEKVFAIDPEHLDAREKALQLRVARKDLAGAADQAAKLARIALARGLEDRANDAVARLRELAPDHPELAALRSVHAAPAPAAWTDDEEVVLEVEPPTREGDELAIAAAVVSAEDVVEDEAAHRPPPPALAPPAPPPPALTPPAPPPSALTPSAPPPAVLATRPEPAPPAAPASVAVPPAPPAAAAEAHEEEDLDDEIEEADFFLQQGLVDEAREALQNLLAFYPEHSKLRARLAELEQRAAPPLEPAPSAAAHPDESFDLGAELAAELGGAIEAAPVDDGVQYSVADVFDQFKKGVAQTVKPEDSETHYDLGIAYKEMGLLDDAIQEFEVALAGRSRKKEVDCLTMIALCRKEKGDHAGAVQSYQRALRSDYLTPEAARAVTYEVAAVHLAAGDPEAALHYLHKVLRMDPGYRDARAIVASLGGGPGRPPVEAVRAGGDAAAGNPPRGGPKNNLGCA